MIVKDLLKNKSHSLDYLLSDKVEDTLSKNGIKIRKFFAPLMRFIYSFQSDYKFVVDSREKLKNTEMGKIFVVNHRQGDDMIFSARAIKKSGYFVFGNKILSLESFTNGYGLWSYGMILLNRDSKLSRKSCYEKMKFIIENGGNIIIFPEGYWNLSDDGQKDIKHGADDHNSENWLIQDFNIGAFRLALELGCEIVPTVLHYDEYNGMKCYAKRGKAITIKKDDNIFIKKNEILEIMYSMYYELLEKYSTYRRKKLEENGISLKEQWEQIKEKLIAFCNIDEVDYKLDLKDEKIIGKAPVVNPVVTNEEVFAHLVEIEYNKDNAYLLSKKLSGKR